MDIFEIRVLRFDGSPCLLAERKYLNAAAAIAAGRLISSGRPFEVWNGDYCVYAPSSRPMVVQPSPRLAV